MGKDIRADGIVYQMKMYALVLPAIGDIASVYDLWKARVAAYHSDTDVGAVKELQRLDPFIVSWELSENSEELTVREAVSTDLVDPTGILTIAKGFGFNPPLSNSELKRFLIASTGIAGTMILTVFLSDKKVTWSPEGVL